tara:strand:+ start:13882 stop:14748 length:867 start_codon:yes stop_codon:yes gene_type:complete
MNKLIGHDKTYNSLVSLFEKKLLPNKILLSGKRGIGKSILINKFLNFLYSKDKNSNNLINNNSHPNIFKIFKKIDKKNIEISQIREMIKFQNNSSFDNKIRTIIIDDVNYLNSSSSNSLLKVIEEPNNNVLFFLINNSENFLSDTLKSRCVEFKLFLNRIEVKSIVNDYFKNQIYDKISVDFVNFYNSPSFLISFIEFLNENSIDYENLIIEDLLIEIIKNKYYLNNEFIYQNLNVFIELFFYKNINRSKNITYKIKDYFYFKLYQILKYNLDLETFFIEFEEKLLSE